MNDEPDERTVVLMGEISPDQQHTHRYPTDFEVEMMIYEGEALTEEEFEAMSEEEFSAWQTNAEKIVRKRMETEE